jgi:hypothetical protein
MRPTIRTRRSAEGRVFAGQDSFARARSSSIMWIMSRSQRGVSMKFFTQIDMRFTDHVSDRREMEVRIDFS